jgi:tetratricopeptide (TPR) repeat protein
MTDYPQQSAQGTGIAQAFGEGASATVNITGFTSEQIAQLLQAAGVAQQARIDELAGQLNTSSDAVRGFFKILQEEDVPVEQLQTKLPLIAQRYVGMLDRLTSFDPEDADAQGYIDDARKVLRQAASTKDYDRADVLLSQAEEAQDRRLRSAEAIASHLRGVKAATRAERGELSLTRLDYVQAAQHFQSAASLVAEKDLNLKLGYITQSADALRTHGDEKGDNAVLAQAIGIYRDVLRESIRERMPLDWAMTQNNLGIALAKLGEREDSTRRLEEAVTAYREALKERTRERVPLDWAMTQTNLGTALWALGKREGGTGRLEEARVAIGRAWDVYQEARMDRYDSSFETLLRSIDDLIARRRSEGN